MAPVVHSCCCIYGAFRSTIFCNLRRWHHHGERVSHFTAYWARMAAGRGEAWLAPTTHHELPGALRRSLAVTTFAGNQCPHQRLNQTSDGRAPSRARTGEFNRQKLCRSHLPRRSDRQLQYLAQRAQVPIPWSNVIVFPKIDACRADAHLFSNFGNR